MLQRLIQTRPTPQPSPRFGQAALRACHTENFQQTVLEAKRPVLAAFFDPLSPLSFQTRASLSAIANEPELAGHLGIVTVDVTQNRALQERYDVQALPAVLLFQNGQVTGRVVGHQPSRLVALALTALS